MNKGDCFILDVDHNIYVYVGPKAKRVEKLKAISAANQIRDQDHNGRAKIDIIGDYYYNILRFPKKMSINKINLLPDEFSSEADFERFFEKLGAGNKDTVPDESAGGSDEVFFNLLFFNI